MELAAGEVAVVTGAASGIGRALATRFAAAGLHVVLADVDEAGLAATAEACDGGGATLVVPTDVSRAEAVEALAAASVERFGAVHVVCNNAGVAPRSDPWFGPLSTWEWVLGVNLWGVIHGVRAFLPRLIEAGGGHIVNTASVAGLLPGLGPVYDATKHAVVALTEDLYTALRTAELPVGVSCLCPGWVRTGILDADRNWPERLGAKPEDDPIYRVTARHASRAVEEGATPAFVADAVVDAITAGRYWVFTDPAFVEVALQRWHTVAEGLDPEPGRDIPGFPPVSQVIAEVRQAMGFPG